LLVSRFTTAAECGCVFRRKNRFRIDPSDIAAYDVIGKNAIKITPGYVYMPSYDLYPTYGDTDAQFF
jgi:hypothetical protein